MATVGSIHKLPGSIEHMRTCSSIQPIMITNQQYPEIAGENMDRQALFTPPVGCPCTPQLLCQADKRGIMGEACRFPGNMDKPFEGIIYSTDGGSGALLSVGLLQSLDFARVEDCILNTNGSASDHIFTFCMWQLG